ncbi:MAG: DUF2341 domain-containing protein [Dehalococcoidia bacterium]|nr:DUF2341 domain-containing protein [Dehalococcoidia bacterium]
MTSGKVMLFYGGNWRLYGRVLTAVSKGSQTLISGYQASNRQLRHNAVAIGDIVYLCYQWGTAAIRFQVYNGGWGAVETPVTPADRPGLLAKMDDSTLTLFWENAASIIKYKEYTISGGSWGSEETFQNETTDTMPSWGVMQASYDGGGRPFLHYATKAAAPYDMIFAEWEPPHADLLGEFVVNQWQEDLPASFHVGQDSAELRGNVGIRHAGTPIELLGNAVIRHVGTPVELLGKAVVRNIGSAELLGEVDVGQDSAELLGNAVIRHMGTPVELLGKFEAQAIAELLGNAEIRQSGPKPWIVGWNLRKSHTITGSVAGAQTNYPIGIKVYYGSGTDGTETIGGATFGKVYCDSKCRVDFGDIRFTKSDEISLLDYWIEEQVDSDYAIIWVEIDSIPASPDTVGIYIYYGNTGASTTSNGDDTFLIFNDCTTKDGWSEQLRVGSPFWGLATVDGAQTFQIEANAHEEKLRIQYDTIISTGRENRRHLTRVKHTSWNQDGYFNWYTPLIFDPTQYDALRYSSYFDDYTIYASVGGVSDTTDYGVGHPSGWYRYEKKTNAAGEVTGYRDNTDLGTSTVDGDYSGGKITFYVNEWNPGLTRHYIDWFAVGKYVDPEPTHTAWGPETTATAVGGVLPAKFEVGQDSAELLGRFEAQATAELLGIVDITHSADLLGRAEVGQNAEDLKAAFDSQVTLNLPAKFVVRHSVPSTTVNGPNFVVAAGIDSLEYPFLRKTWYANGRHWTFYVDNNQFRYMSSTDGITWDGPVDIRATGGEDDGWQVGTYLDDNGYFYYAYWWVNGVPLVFRRGFLESNGTITWSAAEQTATPVPAFGNYYPSICVDDGGYPWITYSNSYLGGEVEGMVTKSSTNDGTWVTAPNYPAQLVAPIASTVTGSIVAMTGGQVFVVRVRASNPNLQGWLCDASGPGALQEKAIGANIDWQSFNHTLVSIGDTAWTAVMTRTGGILSGIYVVKYQSGSWGDSVKAESGGSAPPNIFTIGEDIYFAWKSGSSWRYRVSTDGGASWGASSQLLLTTPNGIRLALTASFADRLTNPLGFSWITDAADIEYGWIDIVSAPELLGAFDVGQDIEDLMSTFAIRHIGTPQNLHAAFELQISVDLLGEFVVRHTRARELKAIFDVGQGSIDLPARFEVGQGSAELLGEVDITHSADLLGKFEAQVTAELLGRFEVGQGSAELLALFLIPRAYDLSGGMGISFDWWGSGGVDQHIDFEMWSLTGGWVGRFPDGPAEWRQVLITWDDLTEVDLDGTRPDSSQIIGIYWTYHTPGVRRIDGIRAWMRQDLLCKVVIRKASASDLLSRFEIQASQDLLGKFVIQQYFNDLKAVFHVDMSVLGPVWDYQYVWQNVAAELEVGMQQGQIEIDPVTSAITARQRHEINGRTIITMCGGNRVYSKGTFIFDAEASAYGGANPIYTPAFGLVENKWDWFAGSSAHAAMVYSNAAGAWYFVTEDDGATESTLIAGIDFTAQHTYKIIWEDASEFPATGRVRFYIDDILKATHIIAVPTHPLQFFLTMDSYIDAASDSTEYTKVHTFSATGYV